MINKISYMKVLVAICFMSNLVGCDNFLGTTPTDILTEKDIYSNQSAFEAHMASLYSQTPFPDRFDRTFGPIVSFNTGELVSAGWHQNSAIPVDHWWKDGYHLIRILNKTIETLPNATAFADDVQKTAVLGEVKFLRAYAYFSLARRYGGVPIVTKVQNEVSKGGPSNLRKPRDKEADVFKFIEKEMTDAINMLGKQSNPSVYRINKWSALAFKSEAMLTAASIAKYGSIQLDGTVGIPQAEAEHYWKSARDAANKVIKSGKYKLYNQDEDRAQNYHNLFLDESESNKERIFVKAYTWPQNGHAFDRNAAPESHKSAHGYESMWNPTLRMVEKYEYINKRDGSLKFKNDDGSPIPYKDPANLFKNKDPRFFASVLYPGAPFKGTKIDVYAQIIEGGKTKGGHGADGIGGSLTSSTGFYQLKWEKKTTPRPLTGNSSDQDYISMRYAQVLLNYAEAEMELDDESEARKYVNKIRSRAGIQELKGPVSMKDYRHERQMELAFDGNRYWDLKRWYIFDEVVNNRATLAIWPTYNKDKDVYTFSRHELRSGIYILNFNTSMYYYEIPSDVIGNNPLLKQNPGY